MTNDVHTHFQQLLQSSSTILETTFQEDLDSYQPHVFSRTTSLQTWHEIVSWRPEANVLLAGQREGEFAQLSLALGHYRHAFSALRLSLELVLSAVDFSAHEAQLRYWMRDEVDITWTRLINPDSGPLSKSFIRAFAGARMAEEAATYRTMAERVYRECSEYVHANAGIHDTMPSELEYSSELVDKWLTAFDTIFAVSTFALAARYLPYSNPTQISQIEPVVTHELGHVPPIREMLGGATDE